MIGWRLGAGIPHPWWHFFSTEWVQDEYDFNSFSILYRCHRCKKDYRVHPKSAAYPLEDLPEGPDGDGPWHTPGHSAPCPACVAQPDTSAVKDSK